jgi:hypothetical protein
MAKVTMVGVLAVMSAPGRRSAIGMWVSCPAAIRQRPLVEAWRVSVRNWTSYSTAQWGMWLKTALLAVLRRIQWRRWRQRCAYIAPA